MYLHVYTWYHSSVGYSTSMVELTRKTKGNDAKYVSIRGDEGISPVVRCVSDIAIASIPHIASISHIAQRTSVAPIGVLIGVRIGSITDRMSSGAMIGDRRQAMQSEMLAWSACRPQPVGGEGKNREHNNERIMKTNQRKDRSFEGSHRLNICPSPFHPVF